MFGVLPGVVAGVGLIAYLQRRIAVAAVSVAVLTGVLALYVAINIFIWNRPGLFGSAGGAAASGVTGNWKEMLVYVWQDYLPRLPFMHDAFADFPPWQRWFRDWVGRFGWGDYGLPESAAVGAAVVLGSLSLAALVACVGRIPRASAATRAELLTYTIMVTGLLALLGYTGYGYSRMTGYGFEQARYLFPLLPAYIGVIGVALATIRRNAGVVMGTLVVVGTFVFNAWGLVLSIGRFYG
jgi:hypothetical protein